MQLGACIELSPDDFDIRLHANAPNERSTGLHQSTIIKSIMAERYPKRFDPSKPLDQVKAESGFAYEHILEQGLSLRDPGLFRPGEISHLGIAGSPDGIRIPEIGLWRLQEYKCTWMSCSKSISDPKFRHWIMQVKGYLYMLNESLGLAPKMLECDVTAFFVNGNWAWEDRASVWKPGTVEKPGPKMYTLPLTFTELELEQNYAELVKHARKKGWL
jgi:hypothetical protein